MYYNFDLGKIRAKSYVTQGNVIHELRHYGSLVTSFKTKEAKTDIQNIVKEHYSTLVLKYALKEPNKRFPVTQLGVDIADLYLSMTGDDINRLASEGGYCLNVRGFTEQWDILTEKHPLPLRAINAGLRLELGKVFLYATFESQFGQIRLKEQLPPGLDIQLKAAVLAKYIKELNSFQRLLAGFS
ncbi:hypothetical protein MOA67_gp297 [Klebsiella phage KpLz-2_45]|uniref:hypothetical protein n=1 Tax=Klebsiella phage KpLz-2_45 TaxID=2698923 RepID=UPI001F12FF4F|nr:hypothetical protein MOA67_gp297 [Klebsiella phage KpLz-2_45]UKS72126.1 hypothetical protein KpLz245_2600 [Klebsiella phage KpLz-2_45]